MPKLRKHPDREASDCGLEQDKESFAIPRRRKTLKSVITVAAGCAVSWDHIVRLVLVEVQWKPYFSGIQTARRTNPPRCI